MTTYLPQPYPLFLAVTAPERLDEVSRVVAWQTTDAVEDGEPELLPVTLIGPHTPGACIEPDHAARLYAYGDTAEEARTALARLVEKSNQQARARPALTPAEQAAVEFDARRRARTDLDNLLARYNPNERALIGKAAVAYATACARAAVAVVREVQAERDGG